MGHEVKVLEKWIKKKPLTNAFLLGPLGPRYFIDKPEFGK